MHVCMASAKLARYEIQERRVLTYYKVNASFLRFSPSLLFLCPSLSKSISFSRVIFLRPTLSATLLFIYHPRAALLELCSDGHKKEGQKKKNKGEGRHREREEEIKNKVTSLTIRW